MKTLVVLCAVISTLWGIGANAAPEASSCVELRSMVDEAIPGWKTVSPNVGVNVLVQIEANGSWQYCPDRNCTIDAGGLKTNPVNVPGPDHLFHPGSTVGALIGKIGNGEIFAVGTNTAFTSATEGPLKVRMNDLAASGDSSTDNSGKIGVIVKLCRPSP